MMCVMKKGLTFSQAQTTPSCISADYATSSIKRMSPTMGIKHAPKSKNSLYKMGAGTPPPKSPIFSISDLSSAGSCLEELRPTSIAAFLRAACLQFCLRVSSILSIPFLQASLVKGLLSLMSTVFFS